MCIPEKKRSLRGYIHDEICTYFNENNLCKYVLDADFLQWMIKQDGKLRAKFEKRFIDIVTIVEEFANARNWQKKLATHAVGGFFEILRNHGCLDEVSNDRVFLTVKAHLYFYIGILSLDKAAMIDKI